jgi:hypothetical protein
VRIRAEFLDGWRTAAQRLVRFQRRHRQRSLLLDAEAARLDPRAMVEAARRIGLILRLDDQLQPADEDPVSSVWWRVVGSNANRIWFCCKPSWKHMPIRWASARLLRSRTVDQLLELYRREQAFRRRLTAERDAQARSARECSMRLGRSRS